MNALLGCAVVSFLLYMLLHNWTLLSLFVLISSVYLSILSLLAPKPGLTPWRKVLSALWSNPSGPELFGVVRFRIGAAQRYIEAYNQSASGKVTITHLLTKALAKAFTPEFSGKISHGSFVPYPSVNIACLVALDNGKDLGWVTIEKADSKPVQTIVEECNKRFVSAREGEERKIHKKASAIFNVIPSFLGGLAATIVSWCSVDLGVDCSLFSIKKHAFGCGIITNIGKNGVDLVWPPFPPICRVPIVVAVSKQMTEAMVVQGNIQPEEVMQACMTFDLRFVTRDQCGVVASRFKTAIENPQDYLN